MFTINRHKNLNSSSTLQIKLNLNRIVLILKHPMYKHPQHHFRHFFFFQCINFWDMNMKIYLYTFNEMVIKTNLVIRLNKSLGMFLFKTYLWYQEIGQNKFQIKVQLISKQSNRKTILSISFHFKNQSIRIYSYKCMQVVLGSSLLFLISVFISSQSEILINTSQII